MARQITIDPSPVPRSTLKQLRIVVKSYDIIQNQAKLLSAIEVVKGKKDNLAKLANNIIKAKDRDIIKLTKEARLCLPGLAKETFVPNKDNKSKVEFV
jgi:hypothetical protein